MSTAIDPDCVECEEPDFECERCGVGFCLDHASAHTVEECDRFRAQGAANVESGAAPPPGEDPR